MSSAALFVTWGTVDVPQYTKYYIEQVAPWFDELYVITNEGRPVDVSWFKQRNIQLKVYPNKSRDFEKYYYWMMEMGRERVTSYDRIAIVNDSVVCYGPIDKLMQWSLAQSAEFSGLNSVYFPTEAIQSYFSVMRQPLLGKVWDHFHKTGVVTPLKEVEEYELKLSKLAASVKAMFPQGKRRGWDELFSVPFEKGIPLVKHHCIMPRQTVLLNQWRRRIDRLAHPDTKAWQYLPLMADKDYTHRNASSDPHTVLYQRKNVVTVQQMHTK